MKDEEGKGRTNIEKEKILAILPIGQELQGDIFNVKIYSSDKEGEDWLFSGLEGNFGLIVDYTIKTKYLIIYHPIIMKKFFNMNYILVLKIILKN